MPIYILSDEAYSAMPLLDSSAVTKLMSGCLDSSKNVYKLPGTLICA